MSSGMHVALTLSIFALSLVLVLIRPRGWHEAWWTAGGAGLLLLLGGVSPRAAWQATLAGRNVLLFLLALLLFSALLDRSGFFEWASIQAAQSANGDARRLFRNVFALGALITIALSLDTTAVILTPLVLAFVGRLELPARPYVFLCAFVANTASLLLPISNLTNLLLAAHFHLPFAGFVLRMALPQCAALLVNYGAFRWIFRRELPRAFAPERLPEALSVVPHQAYFRGAVSILALVLAGYFAAPFAHLQPYAVGFAGCLLLGIWGVWTRQINASILREIAWPLFPFVIGLFVLVRGVEDLGLAAHLRHSLMVSNAPSLGLLLETAFGAGLAANIVNNIPAALLARTLLTQGQTELVYSALLGTNLGPNLTLFGSLATMLVLTTARKKGEDVRGWEFLRVGLLVTPATLLLATLALWLTYLIAR